MKILQISRYGKPEEVIEIVDVPEPKPPKEGEVCASVEYAPINFSELLMIRGRYGVKPPLPAALGQEGSGVILAVGGGVANVKVGDRVAIPLGKAVWRERLVLSAAGLTPLPAAADPQQLSMLRANPPTAAFLLSEYAELRPGDWVLQNAGNSGVGRSVIAFARDMGLKTVSLVRRAELVEELKAAGGDVVLVDSPDVPKKIAEATGGAKILVAFDGVAGEATQSLTASLAWGGQVVTYAGMSGKPAVANPLHVIFKNVKISGFWLENPQFSNAIEKLTQHLNTAARLIAEGKLHVPIAGVYSLSEASEAIKHAERGGKVLLKPT